MYNYDITSIIKHYQISEDKLSQTKITFIDFQYDVDKIVTTDTPFTTSIEPKVSIKELKDETIKRGFMTETSRLFEEIIDKYHEMYLMCESQDKLKNNNTHLVYNTIENDNRKLSYLCLNASRLIATKCRFGPSNVIIVPDIKYVKILKPSFPDSKIIVNTTDIHKDKIFLIRVDSQSTTPGLTMFVSKNIVTGRYMKLTEIMGKIGKPIDDMAFCYILTNIGFNPEKFVHCVYLK
jgi:hypothetical protein